MKSAHCIVKINKEKRKLYYVNDKTKKQNKIYMGKTGGLYILAKKDNKMQRRYVTAKCKKDTSKTSLFWITSNQLKTYKKTAKKKDIYYRKHLK
tara:strand:+ start:6853 stop:7134 length:282 start_codon:yes stop_codon:yes gene_type:complete